MSKSYPVPILADDFCRALQDAGILADPGYYRRIVITAKPNSVVTIDVEMEADDRLVKAIPSIVPTLGKDPQ